MDPKDLAKFTSIGRPLDPADPTNAAIAVLTAVAMVIAIAYRLFTSDDSFLDGAIWGVLAAITFFLAWAIAREIDPDHPLSAFVAAGLALPGIFWLGLPNVFALAWLLLASRIVNRTVGPPAKIGDSVIILLIGGIITFQDHWLFGAMTALAFLIDALLKPEHRIHFAFAGLAAIMAATKYALVGPEIGGVPLTTPTLILLVLIALTFMVTIALTGRVSTNTDITDKPLNPRRVQAAQGLVLLLAGLLAAMTAFPGVIALSTLWAAMLGVAVYRPLALMRG